MIIGGVAVGLLARPRLTADADAVIFLSIDELDDLLDAAEQEGFMPRYPNVKEFARANRLVALHHVPSGVDVDISLGAMPFEAEAIERSQLVSVGNLRLRVPSVEDLIIMKAVAHRKKDFSDIENLVAFHPRLDRERIEYWVTGFAQVLEMPELWTDLAPLLADNE
ncbi:MAG: nucleotidyltransferase [Chloroflexi bacterium]|nr:nucleotidyltransferase [Chloroflexota bacterium]